MRSKRWIGRGLACWATLLLGACASTGPAPVEDLNGSHSRVQHAASASPRATSGTDAYRVERGDTLYSIAFRHGLDFRELARWNRIDAPYTIYPGQTLRLSAAGARAASPHEVAATSRPAHPPATASKTQVAATPSPATPPKPGTFEPLQITPTTAPATPATAATPASTAAPAAPPAASTPAPAVVAPAKPATPAAERVAAVGEINWRWPADGTLVGAFVGGDQTRQGIDISGKAGDAVRAAADGTVVYSGNGLVGYGELIIVKHNASFLSAYGHNRTRMVKEGDHVKAGQTIAEMGSSSASRDSLHFEIRKNGKPVNPLDYLPRR